MVKEEAMIKYMTLMKALGILDKIPPNSCATYTICLADNETLNPDWVGAEGKK